MIVQTMGDYNMHEENVHFACSCCCEPLSRELFISIGPITSIDFCALTWRLHGASHSLLAVQSAVVRLRDNTGHSFGTGLTFAWLQLAYSCACYFCILFEQAQNSVIVYDYNSSFTHFSYSMCNHLPIYVLQTHQTCSNDCNAFP